MPKLARKPIKTKSPLSDRRPRFSLTGYPGFFIALASYLVGALLFGGVCFAQEIKLTASYYSIASLKKEGTYAYSHGQMANGHYFKDDNLTCAIRLFPLGSVLRITNRANGKSVTVVVTDRISKRFATTRIDLSKRAFSQIADLKQGIIQVTVEKRG